jgi:hypothetical protein
MPYITMDKNFETFEFRISDKLYDKIDYLIKKAIGTDDIKSIKKSKR